jgi:hypothetical protein
MKSSVDTNFVQSKVHMPSQPGSAAVENKSRAVAKGNTSPPSLEKQSTTLICVLADNEPQLQVAVQPTNLTDPQPEGDGVILSDDHAQTDLGSESGNLLHKGASLRDGSEDRVPASYDKSRSSSGQHETLPTAEAPFGREAGRSFVSSDALSPACDRPVAGNSAHERVSLPPSDSSSISDVSSVSSVPPGSERPQLRRQHIVQ